MSIDAAVDRYWIEVGQHASEPDLEANLARLVEWIGAATQLSQITNEMVAGLVARRRGEFRHGRPTLGLVSASTVNRSLTMPLRRVLKRASLDWEIPLKELRWSSHILKEPKERVRELTFDEEARLEAVELPEFTDLRRFAQKTGLRSSECLLAWDQVDFGTQKIHVTQKGDDPHSIPMHPEVEKLLRRLWITRDPEQDAVFLYTAQKTRREPRTGREIEAGMRYPITAAGWLTYHRRVCSKAKVADFRRHDERHTSATRLLRSTGNLKAVQKVLGHKSITTTMKYAHINDDDVRAALARQAEDEGARRADHERRKNSHQSPTEGAPAVKKLKRPRSLVG
ncbi:tyrosine-type recombinase/integrase [Chenggangzhangella methanolivorans]